MVEFGHHQSDLSAAVKYQVMVEGQLLLTIAKHGFLSIICAVSLLWASWWLVSSEPKNDPKHLDKLEDHIHSRFFRTDGQYGSVLIYQTMPFIVVALLSFGVIELRKKTKSTTKDTSCEGLTRPSITTYPFVVKSPLGVLTAAEVLSILAILFLVIYSFGRMSYLDFEELEERFKKEPQKFKASLPLSKLAKASYDMGRAAMIPFSLLWIPVSRGSPFLRLIKMPFEHAVKYHIWLAMLMLSMLTFHGVGYMTYYTASNRTYKITEWSVQRESCAVVAGVVALIAGLVMWATSLSIFRRRWYELFFGVHHLYIVFFLFWLYHVMWTVHFFIIPCLLFVIDRFLRMVQSRQPVDVLSAKVLESGALQLRLSSNITTQGFVYHALSSWYLRFPSLSRLMKLQWHFFSVTSTPLDEKQELSIVIKPFGKWTTSLQDQLLKSVQVDGITSRCPFSFKAAVEGPYGDESDFFLRYKTLILVGGGIGVTPFLALLCDVLHRQRLGQRDLPTSIQLYHCVRKPEELCVLNSIDPNEISPEYEKHGLDLRVFAYVTSSFLVDYINVAPSMTESNTHQKLDLANFKGFTWKPTKGFGNELLSPMREHMPQGVSSISTKGKSIWVASSIIASMVGFYLLWGLSNVCIIQNLRNDSPTNYNRAHLLVASMILGTTIFGGSIVSLWWFHSKHERTSSRPMLDSRKIGIASISPGYQQELQRVTTEDEENAGSRVGSPWNGNLQLCCRPHWSDIFNGLEKEYQGQNIGVLVSGSQSMQEDIAKECQRHTNFLGTTPSSNVFHYHSISFKL